MKESDLNKLPIEYDFLFVGLGAANCLLIISLYNNGLLKGKTIAIIEPESKSTNDRTFCFWATDDELAKLNLKTLVSYSWDVIEIRGITKQQIKPLHYFHVKGIDLYIKAKNILNDYNAKTFTSFLKQNSVMKLKFYEIKLENETFYAKKIFDSRPPTFLQSQKNQSHLYQSFYGYKIKTTTKAFDTSTMVMMDFNIPQNNFTQFIYVLPFSEDTALIELTRFGEQKLIKNEAYLILDNYIKQQGVIFEILDYEQGVIPMSSAKMKVDNFGKNWVNMGSRADMLKSTTGYAFHAMANDALVQMEAIKNNHLPLRKPKSKKFVFYDRLLLKILNEKPEYGKIIFETLFKKIPVPNVLNFMREKTNFSEDINIFKKLPKRIFISFAIKDFLQRIATLPVLVLPFLFTIVSLMLSLSNLKYITWAFLALGFLSVGLSHGALDHLTSKKINNNKQLLYFMTSYIVKGALLGIVWLLLPDLALFIFIVYSAWHFGQADFKEWKLRQSLQSLLWGFTILFTILFFHFDELNLVLEQIPNLKSLVVLKNLSETQITAIQILVVACGILLAVIQKSKYIIYTLIYLILSSFLPLLVSFGIFFVGQHSMHGWRHLLKGLNEKSSFLWLKSLPFSIGGALLILYLVLFSGLQYVGIFFIILSCLSLPHVLSMHKFYSKVWLK